VRALKYFKAAFAYHWNLLLFLSGMGFALLSGHADVAAPLVLAGEALYLGLLGTNTKFQSYVDAQAAKAARQQGTVDSTTALQRILTALPPDAVKRFESLRNRCLVLRKIATAIKDPVQTGEALPLEDMQMAGLDRLLWIYLRLLYTEDSLKRFLNLEGFLAKSGDEKLVDEIRDLEQRVKRSAEIADEAQRQKVQKTLEDSLQTSRDRLANFKKARDNLELVQLEIERLENKIRSLSELAVNRQEPDFISGQVDAVASSMLHAEKTMNDLQFATGLERFEDEAPPLMRQEVAIGKR